MAEITKITTPILPQENLSPKLKPQTDTTFDLTDPTKVHRPDEQGNTVREQQREGGGILQDGLGREMLAPLFRSPTELVQIFQRITVMLQMGISTSEIMDDPEVQKLLESLYIRPGQLANALLEQDSSSVLFKGQTFDVLRDILSKFSDNPRVKAAVAHVLRAFEQNVNTENSVKTILTTCRNLLDYMFSKDRAQFSEYLRGLTDMLLPEKERPAGQQAVEQQEAEQQQVETAKAGKQPEQAGKTAQSPEGLLSKEGEKAGEAARQTGQPERALGVDHREAAQILKGNLLPLLGEIVVKYNQNEKIRDMVMVIVHNIVRIDQGSPESLRDSVARLISDLRQLASMPGNFEQQLTDAVLRSSEQVKSAQNETITKLTKLISQAISSPDSSAATIRQTENLLMSLLQNQNAVMNILHFILPMQTDSGKLFAEMYVDPDNDEKVSRSQEDKSRKIFLAFESESLGSFELCFLESGERVDFSMWCPEILVKSLSGIKRQIADIMQAHGYTMNSYNVEQLRNPHNIAEVFPRLLDRRMGVDVRI